ncbi:MAG TPA: tetratricopeptide repeat protein [Terriglobia bacterium]|nr:tetratricopeptide repeat protein [Terriglobia bacterium]
MPEVELTLKKYALTFFSIALLSVVSASPALGVSREIIQMMQQLDTLQQSVQALQNTVSTQTAILHTLLQQTVHDVTQMKDQMAELQKNTEQNLAASSNKMDSMSGQVQALSSSLDQTQAQITKLSEQLAQTQKVLQTLNSPPPAAGTPGVPLAQPGDTNGAGAGAAPTGPGAAAANVPDPNSLYNSAMSSFNSGQYALAIQGFQEFLQTYGTTARASSAQYYIGESYYNNGDYKHAIEAYDKCIERYPDGDKTLSARLKKGYALLAGGNKAAGIRELRALVEQHPQANESDLAAQRLKQLGIIIHARRRG